MGRNGLFFSHRKLSGSSPVFPHRMMERFRSTDSPIAPERGVRWRIGGRMEIAVRIRCRRMPHQCNTKKTSSESFSRIEADESLTIHDLDVILGISESSDWTWERLNADLQRKGISPEKAARRCGIFGGIEKNDNQTEEFMKRMSVSGVKWLTL